MNHKEASIARHVDGERLWRRLMALARFGATPRGGVDRQALSDAEVAARAELMRWGQAIGLKPFVDDAANLFLRLPGMDDDLPPVLVGSHLDSQPTGGKFDGPFGVLAALESVEAIMAAGLQPRRPIEIVSWMNEEGSRFAPGMMGSAVFTGARQLAEIERISDKAGVTVAAELKKVLAAESHVPRRPVRLSRGGLPRSAYRAGPDPGTRSQGDRRRERHPGQANVPRRGHRRRESCGHLAAQRAPRRAGGGGRYRARAAGGDVGPRGCRPLHDRDVQREPQCAVGCAGARRLLARSAPSGCEHIADARRCHPRHLPQRPPGAARSR